MLENKIKLLCEVTINTQLFRSQGLDKEYHGMTSSILPVIDHLEESLRLLMFLSESLLKTSQENNPIVSKAIFAFATELFMLVTKIFTIVDKLRTHIKENTGFSESSPELIALPEQFEKLKKSADELFRATLEHAASPEATETEIESMATIRAVVGAVKIQL